MNFLQKILSASDRFKKYGPLGFFIGGFIWDSLTLQRIDTLYSNAVLLTYIILLTIALYAFNRSEDGRWEHTFLADYEHYLPLGIQFLLGGLCSAYVIFFFQSVSLTQTSVFFLILVALFIANELFKERISNKYLQFSIYFFVTFTFFTFFIPVITGWMNTAVFIASGITALVFVSSLIIVIWAYSPSTRREINLGILASIITGIYLIINLLYFFNFIPPVPLSLETGLMAHEITREADSFHVRYQAPPVDEFWRDFDGTFYHTPGDTVYAFTAIYAPGGLTKSVKHRWIHYDARTEEWQETDNIGYEITGGRRTGYRGYTYKTMLRPGPWQVEILTDEGQLLGRITFSVAEATTEKIPRLRRQTF